MVVALAFTPKGESSMSDKKKIKIITENLGIGIKGKKGEFQYPKYKEKYPLTEKSVELDEEGNKTNIEKRIGYKYFYTLPYGVPPSVIKKMEEGSNVFQDGLGKPVKMSFKNSRLYISVYDEELKDFFDYKFLPDPPKERGNTTWKIPLGKTLEGYKWHNPEHIPHIVVGGTTRFGKTVLLKMTMTYLIEHHPDDVEFYIIDLKGGLEFHRYGNLKQVKGVASDPFETHNMLVKIKGEVEKMQALFKKNYWTNIADTPIKKRTFIIVDEAAQLTPDKSLPKKYQAMLANCQLMLSEIARIAGGLGYREIFCTQYPVAAALPNQIKMNSDAKIALRVPTGYASDVVIDQRGAEELPSNIRGRALYKTHELTEMQIPYISDSEMWERLERFQEPVKWEGSESDVIEHREKDTPAAQYTVLTGEDAIRYQKTNSNRSQTRDGS